MKTNYFLLLFTCFLSFQISAQVNFTASMGDADKKINFHIDETTVSLTSNTKYLWSFGDGATSSEKKPIHTYKKAGDYKICLSVDGKKVCKENVFTVTEKGLKIRYVNDIMWPNGDKSKVDSPFSFRIMSGKERFDFHRALDIGGTKGEPIHAIADGVLYKLIEYEGKNGLKLIVLKHKMDTPMYFHGKVVSVYYSRYLHVDGFRVSEEAPFNFDKNNPIAIKKGAIIADLGSTGSGTYDHCHLEIRIGSYYAKRTLDNDYAKSELENNVYHDEINKTAIDPDVNPLLFLENEVPKKQTLKYSILKNDNTLYVKVYTDLSDNHFNELVLKYNGLSKPIRVNLNTREGLPYQKSHVPDTSTPNGGSNKDYDYRDENDNFEIYPIASSRLRKYGHELIFRFDDIDFENDFKDDYSTPNGNYLYVKDIYGNLAEKTHNNLVINEVNFESGGPNQNYNNDRPKNNKYNINFRDDFIEIVNNSDKEINISGYKIFDKQKFDNTTLANLFLSDTDDTGDFKTDNDPRYVIPYNTILRPGQVFLLFNYINLYLLQDKYDDSNMIVKSVKEKYGSKGTLSINQEKPELIVLTNRYNGVIDIISNKHVYNALPNDNKYSMKREPPLTGDFIRVDGDATPGKID